MPSQWDHKADKDLLLAIIDEGALKSILWPTIARKMQAKGYSFTHEACRQHFQKLRKESKNGASNSSTSSPAKSTPSTPRPRKSSTKTNGNNSSTKPSSFAHTNSFNYDDDSETEMLPHHSLKRQRTGSVAASLKEEDRRQTATLFKMEQMDEKTIDLENDDLYEV